MNILSFIVERLQEKTTWRGLIYMATAAGVTLSPAHVEAIISAGLALAGAIHVFTRG